MPEVNESILAAYCENPSDVTFETQEGNEKIILLLRQHFVTNVPWIVVAVVLVLLPLAIPLLTLAFGLPWQTQLVGRWYGWLLWSWYLFVFGFVFTRFLWWYFNIYVVTNERVVDIDFVGLLYKRVSDAHLSKIQDVTYDVRGFIGVLFHYGDVYVQTAAEEREFDFHAVPHPDRVASKITELVRLEEMEPRGAVV